MNIVILDGYTTNPGDLSWAALEALGEVKVYERTPPEQAAARIGEAQMALTNKTPIDAETIAACPNLRYIGVLATGYNIVDVEAAKARGIAVTNVPAYASASVAQLVFALLLEICHHVGHHDSSVKAGKWTNGEDFCYWDYPLVELAGKAMGIVGYGRIGQATARIARAFGMEVLFFDAQPAAAQEEGVRQVSLEELYKNADVISLHCPLTPATQGMINAGAIAGMKDGVWIINTSRGPLIEEQDVSEALQSGKMGYYAADVACVEPIRADNPLLRAPNTILTPHIAWAPREARRRLIETVAQNAQAFIQGQPVNVVNP